MIPRGLLKKCLLILFSVHGLVFGQYSNDTSLFTIVKLTCKDDFRKEKKHWFSEFEIPQQSILKINEGKMELVAKKGATVWFTEKLSGDYMISFDAMLVNKGGECDRVSDLNLFWMATNPSGSFFNLDGKFPSYDLLHLYYAGIGGNENTTTRFRKYTGRAGDKAVIKEYTDSSHLLKGNEWYKIQLVCLKGRSVLFVNDRLFFDKLDDEPYTEGYFGFRTTRSHILYDNFKVYAIKSK